VKLWGGNYSGDPDRDFWEFNRSFPFDRRLIAEEIAASRAYVRALERCGAIKPDEADRLDGALERLAQQVQADPACLEMDAEDVHSFVETRLTEAVGDLAGQAHLGRSRNEQSVTGLRLWLRRTTDRLRRSHEAIGYARWRIDRVFLLVPAQAYVARYLGSFRDFPPRQAPGSFSLDQVTAKMKAAAGANQ